jgi:CRISPR-associated exonuclease Cas4
MYTEDDLIPISALQHVLFCDRQYSLIHIEQLWEENFFTAEGGILHERVHAEHHESRRFYRQEYGMSVRSLHWGLIGKCDLVELWYADDFGIKRISPVEFKRGKTKASDVDRVQVCAQVLCLEEMFNTSISSGQLYYFQEHRRSDVIIDEALRSKTKTLIEKIRELVASGLTPIAEYEKKKCDRCSLLDMCMPKSTGLKSKSVIQYIENQVHAIRKETGG